MQKNKQLRDLTLQEILDFCKEHPYTRDCKECPFEDNSRMCIGNMVYKLSQRRDW